MTTTRSSRARLKTGEYYLRWKIDEQPIFLPEYTKGKYENRRYGTKTRRFRIKLGHIDLDITCVSGVGGQEREIAESFRLWQLSPGYAELNLEAFLQKYLEKFVAT